MSTLMIGMGIGVMLGGFAGVLVMALCFMARDRGDQ